MNEAEWLSCSEPDVMLWVLRNTASQRKLRLFVCACARHEWCQRGEDRNRDAIALADRFADGLSNEEELETARNEVESYWLDLWGSSIGFRCWAITRAAVSHPLPINQVWHLMKTLWEAGQENEQRQALCSLIRESFGNPFRKDKVSQGVMTWHDVTVPKIAQRIYDERDFSLMPILADALEEAGCDNEAMLRHCREPGEHVRGCWVIDVLLGRE